jgi:hypothetical protein
MYRLIVSSINRFFVSFSSIFMARKGRLFKFESPTTFPNKNHESRRKTHKKPINRLNNLNTSKAIKKEGSKFQKLSVCYKIESKYIKSNKFKEVMFQNQEKMSNFIWIES